MYFLEQLKIQFFKNITIFTAPEGPTEAEQTPKTQDLETPVDPVETADRAAETTGKLSTTLDRLPNPEGLAEGEERPKLTPEQMRNRVITSEAEREAARMILANNGENVDEAAIVNHIVDGRRAELGESVQVEVDGKTVDISREDLISQVAEESGISEDLLTEMKVMGQLGIHDMDGEELKTRLESMTEEMNRIKQELEKDGQTFPVDPAEFLALYEIHMDNDHTGDTSTVNPADAQASGLDVVRDENGNVGIDPNMPGSQVVGDTVIASDGSYSRGGNIYRPHNIQGSDSGVEISVAQEEMSTIQQPNTSPELEAYGNEHNKEIIKNRVPAEWHGAAIKMADKVGMIQDGRVIALATMTGDNGPEAIVCYPDGRVNTFPIIVGQAGYAEGVTTGDKKTPINTLFNFNSGKVAGRGQDASQGGSTTVLGGAAYSPEAGALGGRWWHGVADHRIPGGRTHGCIGAKQENMMMLARAINEHGGGYGMNVTTKKG